MDVKLHKFTIPGSRERYILGDARLVEGSDKLVVFCHGYKGYKDWGPWNAVGDAFAAAGVSFVKFNFSFNGGTIENPIDFPDLEAFSENNYSTELDDLHVVLDHVISDPTFQVETIGLIGHSRGGGIALLGASHDAVRAITTWAAVSDFENRFPSGDAFEQWKEEGVYHVMNGRTKQQMPHRFQFYEDFQTNKSRLDIAGAVSQLKKPLFIVHAKDDMAVQVAEAHNLHNWKPDAIYEELPTGGHTFGTGHPHNGAGLPSPMNGVVNLTIEFFLAEL